MEGRCLRHRKHQEIRFSQNNNSVKRQPQKSAIVVLVVLPGKKSLHPGESVKNYYRPPFSRSLFSRLWGTLFSNEGYTITCVLHPLTFRRRYLKSVGGFIRMETTLKWNVLAVLYEYTVLPFCDWCLFGMVVLALLYKH